MINYLILSSRRCLPCRQLQQYLIHQEIDWEFIYPETNPHLYSSLGVMSTPTLVGEIRPSEYKVLEVGLPQIIDYTRRMGKLLKEEEE